MASLENFKANNSELNLLSWDLNDPQVVKQLNWADVDRAEVMPKLKALQRMLRVAPEPEHAQALLDNDFDSAHKITSVSKQHFVDQMGSALGPGGDQQAAKIYEAAEQRTNQAMHAWGLVNHLSAPHFNALRANAIHPEVTAYFQGMPGYQDLFGSLNYCDCSECKSIFGPAAYFVDLLRMLDKKVTQQNTGSIPPKMSLDERRPDLKQIELTCEKTNHTFPYINIVNERLEDALSSLGTGSDLYKKVAQLYFPFSLPFHLPLTKIRVILAQLETSLSDVLRVLGADAEHVAAELIPVSPEEWTLLTTSNTNPEDLQKCYGVSALADLNSLDTFCAQTGLTILQVQDLFNQNLSEQELTARLNLKFFINEGQSTAPSTSKGQISSFNPAVLDRVDRFVRLANRLSWSFADLDWAIYAVHQRPGDIDATTLIAIAGIQELSQQYKLKVSDVLAFIHDLKTIGVGKEASVSEAPFDRIFNGQGQAVYHPLYAGNSLYTDAVNPPWDSTQTDAANQKISAWVAAGTGLRESDLKILVQALFNGTLNLTVKDLSTVYRHARLSKQLQLRMPDYLLFRQLFSFTSSTPSIEELRRIFLTRDLLKRSGLNELPLADGAIISNIADVTLVSADVVLNTTKAVSDLNPSSSFVELTVGGASQKVKITNSKGKADLGKAAPTEDKIALTLDKSSLPDDLKSDGDLKPHALKNVFIAVTFNSNGM